EDIAELAGAVARLDQVAVVDGVDVAAVKIDRSVPPDKIDVALDVAVVEINAAVDAQRVLKADEIAVADDAAIGTHIQRLGLRAALGRGVVEPEVLQFE